MGMDSPNASPARSWRSASFCSTGIAYMHARAMTHFTHDGNRTPPPESLAPLDKAMVLLTGVRLPKPSSDATPDLPYKTYRLHCDDGVELDAWYIAHPEPKALILLFHGYAF